jgi:hypothetical protein
VGSSSRAGRARIVVKSRSGILDQALPSSIAR